MPATGRFSGTPASISDKRRAAHRRHRGRAVRFGDLRHDAHRIGEVSLAGSNGCTARQASLPWPISRRPGVPMRPASPIDVGREIVVQHEMLAVFAFERVDDLLVLAGAERRDHQRLGFAAGEQRRAMRARQHADFGRDRPHGLGVAAVDARLAVQHGAAHDLVLDLLEDLGPSRRCASSANARQAFPWRRRAWLLARLLVALRIGRRQIRGRPRSRTALRRSASGGARQIPRFLGGTLRELDDHVDHRLECAMAEHHGAQHHLLGQLLGFRFDHQHAFLGAGDDQIELRLLDLVEVGLSRYLPSL